MSREAQKKPEEGDMIPMETLRRVQVLFLHGSCPDGLASAMILKDAFRMLGMTPRIEFLTHNTPEHKNAQPPTHDQTTILFCDIAPWAPTDPADRMAQIGRMRDWAQFHPTTIVFDHHVGAREIVEAFGPLGVYADAETEPGVSGALLAYREVWRPVWEATNHAADYSALPAVNDFAACVGVRDTWQTQDPRFMRGQCISKMLMSKPASWWLDGGDGVVGHAPYLSQAEVEMGRALFEAHEDAVRQAVEQCVFFDVRHGGNSVTRLAVFQEQACGFRLCSDLAEAIRALPDSGCVDVVAGFSYVVDKPGAQPHLVYSLRGVNGFDVQKFATANGGGGHKAAAGFSVPVGLEVDEGPYEEVRGRLETYLRGPK